MRRGDLLLTAMTAAVLAGCATVRPPAPSPVQIRQVSEMNYALGRQQIAYVGQPVVRVKQFVLIRTDRNVMCPTEDFALTSSVPLTPAIRGGKNHCYEVLGETTVGGERLTAVSVPTAGWFAGAKVLVRPDGSAYHKILNGSAVVIQSFSANPPGLRFASRVEEQIDKRALYLNYELIYGGTDGKVITITYREYTPEDLARPAFAQNVVYDRSSSKILFRDMEILIHEVTNEGLRYTVLADGLSK